MRTTAALLLLLVAVMLPRPAAGQPALEELRALGAANAEGYAGPLARGLAHALAGGYADRTNPLAPFRFDLGVRFLGARRGADETTFQTVLPDSVVFAHPEFGSRVYHDPYRPRNGSLESPTVVGTGPGVVLVPDGQFEAELLAAGQDPSEHSVRMPSGLDLPAVPVVVLHGSLGVGLGTDLSVQFLPPVEVAPEMGEARSRGVSVRHALTHWFSSPVDLTLVGGYQAASAGDYLESTARHYGALAGVRAGPMNVFGGSLLRQASTRVTYRLENPELPEDGMEVSFQSRADSSPAYLVGARLQLLALNLQGHYAFGAYDVLSLKLGFGIP